MIGIGNVVIRVDEFRGYRPRERSGWVNKRVRQAYDDTREWACMTEYRSEQLWDFYRNSAASGDLSILRHAAAAELYQLTAFEEFWDACYLFEYGGK